MRFTDSPYVRLMRLHQPVGIWLLLWPCWWSVTLASSGAPPMKMLALFAAGALLMRSAGCIINDIADRDFDRQVERTRTRPLASGELSLKQALITLGILLSLSLAIALKLGEPATWWAIYSLPLVAAYPLMKRISWWPQLFLGFTFNWGALMGWAAVRGTIELPALLLYAGGVFWTLGYDTIYAHQDKADDARIGVKSTALRLGQKTKPFLLIFYTAAVTLWMMAGYYAHHTMGMFALLSLALLHLWWQVKTVELDNTISCRRLFVSNIYMGWLVLAAFII